MEILNSGYSEKELLAEFLENADHSSLMGCGGYGNCNCD